MEVARLGLLFVELCGPFTLEIYRVGQDDHGRRIKRILHNVLDLALRLLVCPIVDGPCGAGTAKVHRRQFRIKIVFVVCNKRRLQMKVLLEPDAIGEIQRHILARCQRLIQIPEGGVRGVGRQSGGVKNLLQFRFCLSRSAVFNHLQGTRHAERRDEEIGACLRLCDLRRQIEGKSGVGRHERLLIGPGSRHLQGDKRGGGRAEHLPTYWEKWCQLHERFVSQRGSGASIFRRVPSSISVKPCVCQRFRGLKQIARGPFVVSDLAWCNTAASAL